MTRPALDAHSAAAGPPHGAVNGCRIRCGLAIAVACGCLQASLASPDQPETEDRSAAVPIADLKRTTPVSFEQEVLPLFKRNCLACHNETKAKANLVLETPATILKGSEDGPVAIPGKSGDSLLLQVAAHAKKPFMPPKKNPVNALPLTTAELGLVKRWIDQGATGVVTSVAGPVRWQPLPPGLNEIDAVAITPDGQFAACGRANQIFLYHLPSGQLVTRLTDPALLKSGFAGQPGVAQRDLVQALAFSSDGQRLASGGYREVKLWRRQPNTARLTRSPADARGSRAIASSPDGKWLALGGADGRIRLWDAVKGTFVMEFSGHTAAVNALRFSPDGTRICSGSADKTIRIWNVGDRGWAGTIATPSELNAVAWVMRGTQIASAGDDRVIRIWPLPAASDHATNAGAPNPVRQLAGHTQAVTGLDALGPDGKEIVSGSRDGTVRVWNVETGQSVRQLEQGGPVVAVAARHDGRRLAAAGLNQVVKLWNAENGQLIAELKGERHAQEAVKAADRAVAFVKSELTYQRGILENAKKQEPADADAVKKATEAQAAADRARVEKQTDARLAREAKAAADQAQGVEAATAKVAAELKEVAAKVATLAAVAAQTARDKAAQAKAALDQATEARAAADKSLVELTRQAKAAAEKSAAAKAFGQNNSSSPADALTAAEHLAAETAAAAKSALDRAAAARIALDHAAALKHSADQAATDAAAKVQIANDTRSAAEQLSAEAAKQQQDGEARVKAARKSLAETEQAVKRTEEAKSRADHLLEDAQTVSQRTEAIVQSAQTAIAAAVAEQKKTEAAFAAARKAAAETESPVRALAFSPDNLTLATGGDDRLVHTWSADDGRGFETFAGHPGAVLGLAFAADGAMAAIGADTNVVMWDTRPAWTLERTIGTGDASSPLVDRVLAVAFSPDGQWLATGGGIPSRSGELKLWRVADGKLVREFKDAHSDTVLGVSFSADGKHLASGAADKFVKIFDPADGKLVKTFEGHTGHVLGVSWKQDGRTLASCGADKVIKVWDPVSGEQKKTVGGFNKEVTSIHFIGPSNELLVSTGDHQIRIVREDGSVVRRFEGGDDFLEAATVTPDGTTVIAGGQAGELRVWSGADGKPIKTFGPPQSGDVARLAGE